MESSREVGVLESVIFVSRHCGLPGLPFRGHCLAALSSLGLLNGRGVKASGW